ncbi:hypothetical protein HAX54_003442, partial [Datura stramonium]|nr:hypothetical protein [Datura stramonium]
MRMSEVSNYGLMFFCSTSSTAQIPVSTDYLYLTVGGTLSNAGISGQTFLIWSSNHFRRFRTAGIITRARIVLDKAPTR